MLRGERTVGAMTRRTRTDRGVVVTRVTFEVGRLGARCLVEAYEQAVPIARRRPGERTMRCIGGCRPERDPVEEVGQ